MKLFKQEMTPCEAFPLLAMITAASLMAGILVGRKITKLLDSRRSQSVRAASQGNDSGHELPVIRWIDTETLVAFCRVGTNRALKVLYSTNSGVIWRDLATISATVSETVAPKGGQ